MWAEHKARRTSHAVDYLPSLPWVETGIEPLRAVTFMLELSSTDSHGMFRVEDESTTIPPGSIVARSVASPKLALPDEWTFPSGCKIHELPGGWPHG
jgi:hypothetical protein